MHRISLTLARHCVITVALAIGATVIDAQQLEQTRYHLRTRIEGGREWVTTAIIVKSAESGVVRSRNDAGGLLAIDFDHNSAGSYWVARGAGLRGELRVASPYLNRETSIVSIGGIDWEIPKDMPDDAQLAVRRAIRSSLPPEDLQALVEILGLGEGMSWLHFLACPDDPVRLGHRGWRCQSPLPRIERISLAPDCSFDASVGFPCDREQRKRARAAKRNGQVPNEY